MISNNDIPRTSEPTLTQLGRFKKDKNETKLKWFYEEGTGEGPQVQYEIAMETLKNSSVQFLLKVDRGYSEQQTELVLEKIKASSNVRGKTAIDRKPFKID